MVVVQVQGGVRSDGHEVPLRYMGEQWKDTHGPRMMVIATASVLGFGHAQLSSPGQPRSSLIPQLSRTRLYEQQAL